MSKLRIIIILSLIGLAYTLIRRLSVMPFIELSAGFVSIIGLFGVFRLVRHAQGEANG